MTGWPRRWEATSTNNVLEIILGVIVSGGGLAGLLFFLLRQWFEKRIQRMEKEAHRRRESQIERYRIEDEMNHATGRFLYWVHRFIVTNQHNGELEEAFKALLEAEKHKKDWDRRIVAEARNDD